MGLQMSAWGQTVIPWKPEKPAKKNPTKKDTEDLLVDLFNASSGLGNQGLLDYTRNAGIGGKEVNYNNLKLSSFQFPKGKHGGFTNMEIFKYGTNHANYSRSGVSSGSENSVGQEIPYSINCVLGAGPDNQVMKCDITVSTQVGSSASSMQSCTKTLTGTLDGDKINLSPDDVLVPCQDTN